MNYAELTANIQEVAEHTFTADQLALFVQQTEQRILSTVELPALRTTATPSTVLGNQVLSMPTGMLYVYSFAVISASGVYSYLLNKDESFIREAYPTIAATGTPKHYAIKNQTQFILGPTPDAVYTTSIDYAAYPESIVTAGTTWLGDEYDSALLNGALVEAARFLRFEEATVKEMQNQYMQSITLLKNMVDGKMRRDTYRSGQFRAPVG